MITGELKSKIDRIWDAMWAGGIANPLTVIEPDGVLFGSFNAHKQLRKLLVGDQKLDAVISMPSGVFKPYAGVSTAILFFTKTNSGGTDKVWFYDMKADGFSLDDKRSPQEKSDLPDILKRWSSLKRNPFRFGGRFSSRISITTRAARKFPQRKRPVRAEEEERITPKAPGR